MSDRDYPNSGIMFRDDKKRQGNDRDRDYKGTADIDCPHCGARSAWWLSAWIKSGRKGKFVSLAFKTKDAGPSRTSAAAQPHEDTDLPW
jgi:hypothetical protein